MDIFDWLLVNGNILDGASVSRIIVICIIFEFIGMTIMSFRRIAAR